MFASFEMEFTYLRMEVAIMHPLDRYRGEAVEVRDHLGNVHWGEIEWVDRRRGGMFLRNRFNRRRFFIPFFLLASIFLLRNRRRIF